MRRARRRRRARFVTQLDELDEQMPPPLPALYSVKNDTKEMTPIHVLARGEYRNKGAKVGMRPLGVLLPEGAPELPLDTEKPRQQAGGVDDRSGESADGARDGESDLGLSFRPRHRGDAERFRQDGHAAVASGTARLAGERVRGERLADEAAAPGDSAVEHVPAGEHVRRMRRLAKEKDPANRLLWKFNRRRLEAEEIRDAMLAVSGRLNLKAGGPSVIVPVDPELIKDSEAAAALGGDAGQERSMTGARFTCCRSGTCGCR